MYCNANEEGINTTVRDCIGLLVGPYLLLHCSSMPGIKTSCTVGGAGMVGGLWLRRLGCMFPSIGKLGVTMMMANAQGSTWKARKLYQPTNQLSARQKPKMSVCAWCIKKKWKCN